MPNYLASKIIDGTQTYAFVFSISSYLRYQDAVDAKIIELGRADLLPEDRKPK